MQKTIAIYFSSPEPMGYPLDKPPYLEKYREIIASVENHDIDVFIVRGDSYTGNGQFKRSWKFVRRFKRGWRFVGDNLQKSDGEIKADLIFNRDSDNTIPVITDCPIINHPEFDALCTNKVKTFETFPDISPKSAAVNSYNEYVGKVRAWNMNDDDLIVLKKNFEAEGKGIFIIKVGDSKPDLYDSWNDIMIQEFLDSSIGIPGIVEGLHDLRITVVNGEPINSFLRAPQKGSLVANVARGGKGTSVNLNDIPKEVLDLVYEIDENVKQYFPAIYAADFIRSDKGYKLLELNSRPGVQHPDWSATHQKFNNAIVDMLVGAASS